VAILNCVARVRMKIATECFSSRYGLTGRCRDAQCQAQHLSDIKLEPSELYLDLLSYCPSLLKKENGENVESTDPIEVQLKVCSKPFVSFLFIFVNGVRNVLVPSVPLCGYCGLFGCLCLYQQTTRHNCCHHKQTLQRDSCEFSQASSSFCHRPTAIGRY